MRFLDNSSDCLLLYNFEGSIVQYFKILFCVLKYVKIYEKMYLLI